MAVVQAQASNTTPDSLLGIVAGRFLIKDRLGTGGMGEVYRAEDTKLKRQVALKRMASHLRGQPLYRERFLQEAERASRVSDPHVAALHDVFEENGEIFLVMEYVEGLDLRKNLQRPVTLKQVMDIAVQCAQALVAAHEHGIVHCDIKPENIMLTSTGQVKILDFGVAKHLPRSDQSSTLERSDSLRGTLAYMAPEVLRERAVDGRADIFSLGVVFYEMLTGRHPFRSDSFVGTCERILHESPRSVTDFNSDVPPALRDVINKMLAKDPGRRYANAAELLHALATIQPESLGSERLLDFSSMQGVRRGTARWLVVAFLVTATILMGGYELSRARRWTGNASIPGEKQLAVLPFVCSGSDPNQQAFCDGITETITVQLSQLAGKYPLQVVPASELRGQGITSAEELRKKYGVNLVLEGSLRESGSQARVSYSLIDATNRRQLRADSITENATDPFALEDRVVDGVLYLLDLELSGDDRKALSSHGTAEPAAYDYYLRGRGYLQDFHRAENVDSAIVVFNHALERDPNYALAYAGLGEAYWDKYQQTHNSEWVSKASRACELAVNFGKRTSTGYTCSGVVYNGTGQYERAVQEFQQALKLDPTSDDSYLGLAGSYEQLGKLGDAETTYGQAVRVRPQYWGGYNRLGAFYWRTGRYPEAVDMFQKVVALAPDNNLGYSNLGAVSIEQGRYPDAISWFRRSVAIRPTYEAYSNLATTLFYLGRFDEAGSNYDQAIRLDENNYVLWGNLGEARYWASADHSGAAEAYQRAVALAEKKLHVNSRDAQVERDLALYHAMLLERLPALSCLQEALRLAPRDLDTLIKAALVHKQIGEDEQALNWLQKAVSAGYSPALVRDNPAFASLAVNQSFRALISGNHSAGNGKNRGGSK